MRLCITEKPSVAQDIAKILGANVRRDGYYEGTDCKVTWTYGHLCTLKEPADYTERWKRWSLSSLPMIPERFGIKVIDQASIKRQFNVIEKLIGEATEVINCGDAGQEGELIQRWVMQKAKLKCPVKRLWISSLTDDSIKEGFMHLKPESEFTNLYYAGLSRAIGDWILGLNATRLYTLKYSEPGRVLSIGRVQTPTLAIVVKRELEILNFKPEDYWEIKTLYRDVTFNSLTGKYKSEAEAMEAMSLIEGKEFTVVSIQEKQGKEAPLRLFDLTSLQVECNKRWGWSADETLSLIQTLYEKKVTTYPRVDTTYLSDDIYPKIPDILKRMTPYERVTQKLLSGRIPKSKKVFDNSKVTDHHAIIPTGESPRVLDGKEKQLYHLIACRFIAAFYPDCLFSTTTVEGESNGVKFKATGKVIVSPGWREVMSAFGDNKSVDNDDSAGEGILPAFVEGEHGPHEPSLLKKQTQPPKFYTEGTLLRAMESAGKTIDDDELRDAMKENGIGRPSTRAAIIETLFRRGYLRRERKSVHATQAGIELIDTIKDDLLKSARLTGIWENKLRRIERGDYSAADFMAELKSLIHDITLNVLSDNSLRKITIDSDKDSKERSDNKETTKKAATKAKAVRSKPIKDLSQIVCPECGVGHLIKGRTAYGCSRYNEGCGLRLLFTDYDETLTPSKLNQRLKKEYGRKQ